MKLRSYFFLSLSVISIHGFAHAEPTSKFSTEGLQFVMRRSDAPLSYALEIKPSIKKKAVEIRPEIFALENPPRIVIDIPGFPSSNAKKIDLHDESISSVRIGVHKDKTRIVFDLTTVGTPTFDVEHGADKSARVTLNLTGESSPLNSLASADHAQVAPSEQKPAEPKPEPSAPAEKETPVVLPPEIEDLEPLKPAEKLPLQEETSAEAVTQSQPEAIYEELTSERSGLKPEPTILDKKNEKKNEVIRMVGSERVPDATDKESEVKEAELTAEPDSTDSITEVTTTTLTTTPSTTMPDPIEETEEVKPRKKNKAQNEGEQKPTSDAHAKLSGLFFKSVTETGALAVLISVENLNDYKLTRPKPDLYELILFHTKLEGNHLTLPQFPPDDFQGFEAVAAIQKDDNVIVRIFIDEGVKLSPFRADGQLWVQIGN